MKMSKKKNTRTTSWISPFIQICTNILQGLFYVGTVGRLIHSPSWTRSKSCMRPTAISNRFEDGRFFKWIHGLSRSLTKQCWCFYFENVTGHSIVIGDLTTGGTVLLTETRRTDDSIGQFCMIMVWMDIFHRVMMMYSHVWVAIFRKKNRPTLASLLPSLRNRVASLQFFSPEGWRSAALRCFTRKPQHPCFKSGWDLRCMWFPTFCPSEYILKGKKTLQK